MRVLKTKKPVIFRKAFVSLIRPVLEYAAVVWCPSYVKDINRIENVQRSFTRRVFARCGLPYTDYHERLKFLKLSTLSGRRMYIDLLMTFKIVTLNVDLSFDDFFVRNTGPLIGHGRKLFPHHISSLSKTDTQCNTLAYRVYKLWNELPNSVVNAPSVPSFKRRLRKSLMILKVL
jgi:hypothetical protein